MYKFNSQGIEYTSVGRSSERRQSKSRFTNRRIPSPAANVVPYNAVLGEDYHKANFMAGFKMYAVSSPAFSSSEPDREII